MPNTDERALGEQPEDVTPEPDPGSFDVAAFIDGVRPGRRSVRIYPNAHLIERVEALVEQIEATPDGEAVDDLIDEYEATLAKAKESRRFVFEQRSREWIIAKRQAVRDALGVDAEALAAAATDEKLTATERADAEDGLARLARATLVAMMVEQCVEPVGVTADQFEQVLDANPVEADRLAVALAQANESDTQAAARVLTRDFSRRRSDQRGTRRSSRRSK